MAPGWSPVGTYDDDVLCGCIEGRVSRMAGQTTPRPSLAYAGIMGTFLGGVAAAGVLAHMLDRDARDQGTLDLFVLAAATYKAARTVSRDEVTSFIREPFVVGEPDGEDEKPVETGDLRQAIGELVTCSRCIGTWIAAGLGATQILAPRFGRLLTWTLAAGGLADWLLAGFTALTSKANELERRAG